MLDCQNTRLNLLYEFCHSIHLFRFLEQILQVVLIMDVTRLNIYKRLRDFKVPSSVLDDIFSNDEDLKILEDAFSALVDDGFSEDESAENISKMIFKELDIDLDQSLTEEK